MPGVKGKSGGKREGAGRSTFKPTAEQRKMVKQLAATPLLVGEIAEFVSGADGVPISEPTLRKYFKDELSGGRLKVKAAVYGKLISKAMAGDNACMFFYLKAFCGASERVKVEHSGVNGAPIQSVSMTPSEFEQTAKKIADEI